MKKRLPFLLAIILVLVLGCKAPEEINKEIQSNNKPTQEIVIKQELQQPVRTLTVLGEGVIEMIPDIATVQLGVTSKADSAEEVDKQNQEIIQNIITAIQGLGILQNDIAVREETTFSSSESEKTAQNNEEYIQNYIIILQIKNMDIISKAVEAAIEAGASEVLDVQFLLHDETMAYQEALVIAIENAKAKAEAMALRLDVDLQGPGSVLESDTDTITGTNTREPQANNEQELEQNKTSKLKLYAEPITIVSKVKIEFLLKYPAAQKATPTN